MSKGLTDAHCFYAASVPICQHYLTQLDRLLNMARSEHLKQQLAPDMLDCGNQINIAQGFAPRAICPLIDRDPDIFSTDETTSHALHQRHMEATAFLGALQVGDFKDSHTRTITHRAGEAELTQSASDFLTLYALPNMLFHTSMAYATLRNAGVNLSKSDFDGFHQYAEETCFV